MGCCCGVQVDLDETQEIQFNSQADRLIQNPYSPYKGILVQDPGRNGNKVFRTTNAGNPDATVVVYSYTSTPPVTGGTYVVLQFKESGLYFACKGRNAQLVLQKPEEGTDATKITSTADPRVFLMKLAKNSTTDFVFASYVASQQSPKDRSKALVITLLKNTNKPAKLRLEGNGPTLESQWFQLENVSQEGAGEQSDECQVQEEQHRN
ncbi:hypothetical protein Bbelb_024470 [Branchiostoma belcheri]|nr:hypothetical protein Bbelb_024470 [Branchiostoma belcheri]